MIWITSIVQLVLVNLVEGLGRYTDISITNCNTVYITSCRLTTRGFTIDAELSILLKNTSMFLVRAHALSVL